jgi:hypothetical protein
MVLVTEFFRLLSAAVTNDIFTRVSLTLSFLDRDDVEEEAHFIVTFHENRRIKSS